MSHGYLSVAGFWWRAVIYFGIWLILAFILNRWSLEQDNPPVQNLAPRFRTISAPGIILYAFTITFAVIDWVMSLDPHWYSTIFGFIFIAGQCLSAMCMMVVIERILVRYEPLASLLKPKEVHDHGKLMLTFVLLWAYFSFSQLLITWAGNLPMEIRFYARRLYSGWEIMGLGLVIFHFGIPFLYLLSRPFKRNPYRLVKLAILLIFMRFIDLFWYIEPTFHKQLTFHWGYLIDLLVPIAMGGFWMAMFFRNLRSRPMLPLYDLHAQEFLEYAGAAHD
jgi:glucan phosphoethanolaminetransferase (alkaline phosphatase superfamily)